MTEETWKPAVGHPHYEVSDLGRVRSITRPIHNYVRAGRVLIPGQKTFKGKLVAMQVRLGRGSPRKVHHLVLEAFVGPRGPDQECCHNDGNPANNLLTNLRWDTHSANMEDSVRHGTNSRPPIFRGEAHAMTSLTERQVLEIRRPADRFGLHVDLSRQYGVSNQTIRRIRQRIVWKHVA